MRLRSWPVSKIRFAVIAGVLVFASATCGRTSTTITATPTGGAGPVILTPKATARHTVAPVGADCAMVPAKGRGSLGSVSSEKAITAAAGNRQLSSFIAAVRSARLERTLNSRRSYTLVIPDNGAFAALARTQMIRLRESGQLPKIVKYHAVPARISPQQFASGATPMTLQGKPLRLSKAGSVYLVNDATVLCGNIRTSNATVYIVNKVLLPPR
jgi:uncharacterized surface protein with fasciclin (FAS1) repeats